VVDRRASGIEILGSHGEILPFFPACKVEALNWDPESCELCKQGIPVIKPGSRRI